MRTTAFGETVIESVDDDLGLVVALQEHAKEDIYAIIRGEDDEMTGKYDFEIMRNEDGESLVISELIFDSEQAIRNYLRGWVSDIQKA